MFLGQTLQRINNNSMANIRQFKKGETIKITVTPDSGVTIEKAMLYVYPDGLDLSSENAGSPKIQKISNPTTVDGNMVFTLIPSQTGGDNMPAGDYTIELKYGTGDDISIVSQNHAFTLVESGCNIYES